MFAASKTGFIRKMRVVLSSLLLSIILFFLSYLCTNAGFTFFNDMFVTKFVYAIKSAIEKDARIPSSVVLINVGYDKELVPAPMQKGVTPITNRNTLYSFLSKLSDAGEYRYVFLDVIFEEENTSIDSTLFATIKTMPNIVVGRSGKSFQSHGLSRKEGRVDYKTTFSADGLSSYILAYGSDLSFAAKAYYDLTGHKIHSSLGGLYCSDDGRISLRSITPKPRVWLPCLKKEDIHSEKAMDRMGKTIPIMSMGTEVLDQWDVFVRDDDNFFKGKDIIIGDFINDEVSTYIGQAYGPIVHYNAFLALMEGEHFVSLGTILLQLLCIMFLVYITEYKKESWNKYVFWIVTLAISWVMGAGSLFFCGQSYNLVLVLISIKVYSEIPTISSYWSRIRKLVK